MLKASIEVLTSPARQSFIIRTFDKKGFTAPFHFHPECELTLIVQGSGKRYIGTHMANYTKGDLLLLGSNLPHCWKLNPSDKSNANAKSVVIQFTEDFLGKDFFNCAEVQSIKKLLQKCSGGLQFLNKTRDAAEKQMMELVKEKDNFKAMVRLLQLLQLLASSADCSVLDQKNHLSGQPQQEQERINSVFAYIVDNFQGHISLRKAAETINMTPNAFCKYFKKMTRKTFIEAVMEYRINYAVQQLVQTDKPVNTICYESGFGDVSHFHKTFKSYMQVSPLHYRKKFLHDLHN